MKLLRAPFFRWLAHGRRGYFALALTAMATLLVAGVSCSKAPEPERKVKLLSKPDASLDYIGQAWQLHDLRNGPCPGL